MKRISISVGAKTDVVKTVGTYKLEELHTEIAIWLVVCLEEFNLDRERERARCLEMLLLNKLREGFLSLKSFFGTTRYVLKMTAPLAPLLRNNSASPLL